MSGDSKAFIYTRDGPGSMAWKPNYPLPSSLGKSDMLVKVMTASLNPLDYKIPSMLPFFLVRRNTPVGNDLCGIVEAVGSNVTGFSVGDRVFGFGSGLADHTVVKSSMMARVPEGVSTESAGAVSATGVMAYQMLRTANAFDGPDPKQVVVIGASGGVGSCAVQIARAKCPPSSRIYGVCSGKNTSFVKSLGADEILDYTTPNFDLSKALPSKSVDVIIDCVSSPEDHNYVPEGIPLLKERTGKYISSNSPHLMDHGKMLFELAFGISLFRGPYSLQVVKQSGDDLKIVGDMLKRGELKVHLEERVPFAESPIRAALEKMKERRTRGKIIVVVDKE